MIYTSYFGNWRKWQGMDVYSIAKITPKGVKINGAIECFMPSEWTLWKWKDGVINEEEYGEEYFKKLEIVSIEKFIEWVGDRDIVLLCYEKSGEFCHRHLLAEFLKEKGYECKELGQM